MTSGKSQIDQVSQKAAVSLGEWGVTGKRGVSSPFWISAVVDFPIPRPSICDYNNDSIDRVEDYGPRPLGIQFGVFWSGYQNQQTQTSKHVRYQQLVTKLGVTGCTEEVLPLISEYLMLGAGSGKMDKTRHIKLYVYCQINVYTGFVVQENQLPVDNYISTSDKMSNMLRHKIKIKHYTSVKTIRL